jgi:fatty acid amide hydrolase
MLTETTTDYTTLSATTLARLIRDGELSATDVVEAHLRRIEAVNRRLNAVVWPLFDEARSQAVAADQLCRRGGVLGPLHGVPVTVKECFDVAGTPSTYGLTTRVGTLSASDSPPVRRLRSAGAIVLGKTNLSHLLILLESDNPVYGRTNNPWSLDHSPGGSSGGEAANLAAGGAPLGLGSDIGGSVRIPAHFCGVAALKPTSGRLSTLGSGLQHQGQEGVLDQPGPMARRVEDLALAMSVLAAPGQEKFDSRIPPVAWPDYRAVDVSALRIGFYVDDGFFQCSASIRRAVMEAVEVLRGRGAEMSEFFPPRMETAMSIYLGLLGADGAQSKRRLIGKGEADARVRRPMAFARLPRRARTVIASLAELAGYKRIGHAARAWGRCSVSDYWQLVHQRDVYRAGFLALMEAQHLDALVCPPYALPALPHGVIHRLGPIHSHAVLFNLLGLPAGVLPATRVQTGEAHECQPPRDMTERLALSAEKKSAGMPVGVQVAARHWREDIVLALMAALEEDFRGRPDYPTRPAI